MECKFKDVTESAELFKKSSAELYSCGCEKCEPIAKEKELAELRAEKQKQLAQQAVREEEEKRIQKLEEAVKGYEEQLNQVREEERKKLMEEKGLDKKGFLNNPLFDAWMNSQFAQSVSKNIYTNTKYGRDELSPEMKNFVHYAKTGQFLYKDMDRTNNSGVVPTEFVSEVQRKVAKMVAVRAAGARVFNINRADVDIPVESAQGAGQWYAEKTKIEESAPSLTTVNLKPHKYGRIVMATEEFLQDSPVTVVNYLSDVFAEDFANAEDAAFLSGAGSASNQPQGITTDSRITPITYDTATDADNFITALSALPSRVQNTSTWVMNAKTRGEIRTLKDGNGRYLLDLERGGITEGIAGRLLGLPIRLSDNLADGEVVVGDFSRYFIAQNEGMTVRRSDEYGFDTGQIAFRAHMRVDGKVSYPEYFQVITGVTATDPDQTTT